MFANSSIIGMGATLLWIAGALATPASAAVITVTNPGFVATVNNNFINPADSQSYVVGNALPVGLYTNTLNGASTGVVRKISDDLAVTDLSNNTVTATVAGWLATNTRAGVANFAGLGDSANLVTLNNTPPSGLNVGFTQVLPGNVQLAANTTYTLSMVVRRLTIGLSPTFTADLTVGGTPVGGTLAYSPPPNDATPGSAVVTYTTNGSPLVGNLGILISASDTNAVFANLTKVLIDDVSLTAFVPEPGSIGVAALGGLALLRRRR
jgi:hypothetical protein